MSFVVLDTDVSSASLRGRLADPLRARLAGQTWCISFVTVGELTEVDRASTDVIGIEPAADLMGTLLKAPVPAGFVSRCLVRLDAALTAARSERFVRQCWPGLYSGGRCR